VHTGDIRVSSLRLNSCVDFIRRCLGNLGWRLAGAQEEQHVCNGSERRWVDDGINIQSCSRVPSAAPLKYDSITLWDKMNRIHHFDVFVRFVRPSSSGSLGD
jgi:hypothetical protein